MLAQVLNFISTHNRDFIIKVWGVNGERTAISDHLQKKLNALFHLSGELYVTSDVMISFMRGLSPSNLEELERYIKENH